MLPIPVVIVSTRSTSDVVACLGSLAKSNYEPAFDVYVCENGGGRAFSVLCEKLSCFEQFTSTRITTPCSVAYFRQVQSFTMRDRATRVFVAEANENVGYAGGVNLWLRELQAVHESWPGALILNPDTIIKPDALHNLVRYSEAQNKGMVTGCIVRMDDPARIQTRGLRWLWLRMRPGAVGKDELVSKRSRIDSLELQLDAPSGAFIYVTRQLLSDIGLMKERYFLYGEDFEWGYRARRINQLGYCFDATVFHRGGTTINTNSVLSTYLLYRSNLLLVRDLFPRWLWWSFAISIARAVILGIRGDVRNMQAALRGVGDGLCDRDVRPNNIHLENHS